MDARLKRTPRAEPGNGGRPRRRVGGVRSGLWWLAVIPALAGAGVLALSCARAQPPPPPTEPPPAVAPDDLARAREALLERLIACGYLKSERVIRAMRDTPRHRFIPPELWPSAYLDTPLPIGHDQTISAPSIVAVMTELIDTGPNKTVLEIGTGSGYQAAVLSRLCKQVYTIEIVEPLATSAAKTLAAMGYKNVTVKCGDGYKGWPAHAPFDGIMVTCAPERVPQPLVEQLRENGRMVIPVGKRWEQELVVLRKVKGALVRTTVLPVLFVPMTGEAERQEQEAPPRAMPPGQ